MKQQDLATIIVVAFVSAVISVFASSFIFKAHVNQNTMPTTDVIPAGFSTPDSRFFNNNSIDPAQTSTGGTGNNSNPFGGIGQ